MAARRKKSKKQSDASLQLEEELTFFIDRSLGHKLLAQSLLDNDEKVIVHDDLFAQDTIDEVWLEEAGKKNWIVLTHDTKIRYRKSETDALLAHDVRAFVLTAKKLTGKEIAGVIVKALPRIKKLISKTPAPFIAHITRSGDVKIKPK